MLESILPPEGLSLLLKDIFDISCRHCALEEPVKILPDSSHLFINRQFLKPKEYTDLIKQMKKEEVLLIMDRLYVCWLLAQNDRYLFLAGPFLAFSVNPVVIRKALHDLGYEKDSLTDFNNYQSTIPSIEDNLLKALVRVISRGFLGYPDPEVRWVELYKHSPVLLHDDLQTNEYAQSAYEIESEYLEAVYMGNTQGAINALQKIHLRFRNQSAHNPQALTASIYGNAINCTLARIAAYQAGVSPVLLDRIFQEQMILSLNESSPERQMHMAYRMTALVCEQVQYIKTLAYSPLIRQTVCYLLEHYSQEIRLEKTADLFGVHKNYLSAEFTRETGQTFSEYLMKLRLNQAALRIRMSMEPIGDIAARAGFADQNYFARMFRKHYGVSPSAYRKQR